MNRHCTPAAGRHRHGMGALLPIVLAVLLAGCSSNPARPHAGHDSAAALYEQGSTALAAGKLVEAEKAFNTLMQDFPSSTYARQARLELAYNLLRRGRVADSIAITEKFIEDYPQDISLPYAYYLRALGSFQRAQRQLAKSEQPYPQAAILLQQAITDIDALNRTFPDSQYRNDAGKRRDYLENRLTGLKLEYAKKLVSMGDYPGAISEVHAILATHPDESTLHKAQLVEKIARHQMDGMGAPQTAPRPAPAAATAPDSRAATITAMTGGTTPPAGGPAAEHVTTAGSAVRAAAQRSAARPPTGRGGQAVAGPKQQEWLLRQPAGRYTIQLLSTRNEQALRKYASRHHLDDRTAYFSKQRNGETWYALVFGLYDDARAARAAIHRLPNTLRDSHPWVVSLDRIQQSIRAQSPDQP